MSRDKLILIELNEVNFDVAREYVAALPGKYPALEKLLSGVNIRTTSETKYEELEPWIQWVSVHSGLAYSDHQVFRLGDIVGSKTPQFFEVLEKNGVSVGCISPMNAENRLRKPAYFIPDPWTKTPTDDSWWSKALGGAVAQAVNDNAQSKITCKSAVALLFGALCFAKLRHYPIYIKLALNSRGASWRKALFLDLLLHDIHLGLMKTRGPQFSCVFLNAGAHIQHHYFFNAAPIRKTTNLRNPTWYVAEANDPFGEMLEVYDRILGEYYSLQSTEVMTVTGLAQKPYDRIKFYYRLKNHESFLKAVGIEFKRAMPRMTRDFLVEFDSKEQAQAAESILRDVRMVADGVPVFDEIDNRGDSLFVTLTYPNEMKIDSNVEVNGKKLNLYEHVAFVAIKNGMHQEEGFAFFTPGVARFAPQDGEHVKNIYNSVLRYFGNYA